MMNLKLKKVAKLFRLIGRKTYDLYEQTELVKSSPLFDEQWYLAHNPDVKAKKMDAAQHYVKFGWREGRAGSPYFDERPYANKGMPPILYYELYVKNNDSIQENPLPAETNMFPMAAQTVKRTFNLNTLKKRRLAVFASFSSNGKIEDDVVYYLEELKKVADNIIFIMDNPIFPKELDKIKHLVCFACCERHGEYDFGSYKRGFLYAQQNNLLRNAKELVVCNDSCFAPVYPFAEMFNAMEKRKCDFWGSVSSPDVTKHILSFFYVFKRQVFCSDVFTRFMNDITKQSNWWDVVRLYERSLTQLLENAGFVSDTYIPLNIEENKQLFLSVGNNNKTLMPLTLIKKYKYPFIKKKGFDPKWEYAYQVQERPDEVLNFLKIQNPRLYGIICKKLNIAGAGDLSLKAQIKNYDVISFDIFDTLLIRPYVKPIDLFIHMNNFYKVPDFASARIAAEERARNKYSQKEDVTHDDIYKEILPEFAKYKSLEIEFEKKVLRKHPQNYQLYQEALAQNKTIIVTSDMYFSSKVLSDFLRKNGYKNINKIFVSCEYNKCKGNGHLFEEIKKCYPNKKILHIGDNYASDVLAARKANISAWYVEKYIDTFLNNSINLKFKNLYETYPSFENSMFIAMSGYRFVFKHKNADYYKDFGYSFGGPLAVGYCQFIYRKAVDNELDTLLFVSRDGYVLKRVFEKMYGKVFDYYYIYAPRILNIKCFADYRNETSYLAALLDFFHITKKADKSNFQQNQAIFKKNKKIILEKVEKFKKEYLQYIDSLNIKGKKIASVDMTTGAFSSEIFLSRIFKEKYKLGFFYASFQYNNAFKYYTYNPVKYNPQDAKIAILTELLITAPELPVIDVKDNKPVYQKSSQANEARIQASSLIIQGIEEFIDDYQNWFKGIQTELPFAVSFSFLDFLCRYPSTCDEDAFKKIGHSDNIENDKFVSVLDCIRQ